MSVFRACKKKRISGRVQYHTSSYFPTDRSLHPIVNHETLLSAGSTSRLNSVIFYRLATFPIGDYYTHTSTTTLEAIRYFLLSFFYCLSLSLSFSSNAPISCFLIKVIKISGTGDLRCPLGSFDPRVRYIYSTSGRCVCVCVYLCI